MKQKSKNVLEFRKIIENVEAFASTDMGRQRVKKLDVCSDLEEVRTMLKQTSEAVSIIFEKGQPPLGGISDITGYAKRASIGGTISIKGLLCCADTLRAARLVKNYVLLNKKAERNYEILESLCQNIYADKTIEDEIYRVIISEEQISDDASYELKRIRREITNKNTAIRNKINAIVNSSETQKYLQDNIVTMRNDRYVVPVRAEYRSMIKGLVHDQSSSGATLFIEPMQIVEMNNQLSELKIAEKKEIERILYVLSAMIAEIYDDIKNNQSILQDLDFYFAKGKYALSINAIEPKMNDRGFIRIKKGRHPLIDKNQVVPIDVWLGDEFTQLIITGPNTGGKTVTLKTLGLFSIMAMAGLFVPAEYGTELSTFDAVFADIGDEQSIEQSLSTFSSHMTNIVKIMNEVTDRSFVLFDELGAGTDPDEGAALAMSILDTLHTSNIITAATTHYSELKLYALTSDGVCNGSVEFNVETLSPTYKVLIGVPGKSNAFAISKKIGLDDYIINKAKSMIEKDTLDFEDALNQIEKDRIHIEQKRMEIDRLKLEQEKELNELKLSEKKTAQKTEKLISNANYEARKIVEDAKKEAAEIIKELKKINLDMNKENSRKVNDLRQNLNDRMKKLDDEIYKSKEQDIDEDTLNQVIKKGDSVLVRTLNQKGYVIDLDDQNANVQLGLIKMKVKLSDLVKIKSEEEKVQTIKTNKIVKMKSKSVKSNIDLRGMNLDEALMDLDKYLDDAYMSGLGQAEIIHGKGTGVLREGVKQFLKGHRHIKDMRFGAYNEGGDGVTIVTFK